MTWGELKKQAKLLEVKDDAEVLLWVEFRLNLAEKLTYRDDGVERGGAELIISNV